MKVIKITSRNRKKDGKQYWDIALEGSEIPLLMFTQPEFKEGVELDKDSLQVSRDGKYYMLATQSKSSENRPQKSYGKSPEETASIERQVRIKATVEVYNHCTEENTPFDKEIFNEIYNTCRTIMNKDGLVGEAEKLGGKEK
jgi:hypothetical protein